jgi:hypothetical protein
MPAVNSRGRARLRLGTVLALVALLVTGPTVAWSLWSAETSVTTTATTGTVTPPSGLRCERVGGGLLQTAARVSWQPGGPSGTTHRVLIDDGHTVATTEVGPGVTSLVLDRGLLSNLLVGLLELLLGGGVVTVTVETVHPSGWTSEDPVESVRVTGGLLGIYCA